MWHPVSDSSVGKFGRFCAQILVLTISMENVGLKSWKWQCITWICKKRKTPVMEDPSPETEGKKWGSTSGTGLSYIHFDNLSLITSLPAVWEIRVQSLGQKNPLKKEMATHSSILAWKIPWMEEPGRLQSMGLQRVGHDWATSFCFNNCLDVWRSILLCNAHDVKNICFHLAYLHETLPPSKNKNKKTTQPLALFILLDFHRENHAFSLVAFNNVCIAFRYLSVVVTSPNRAAH